MGSLEWGRRWKEARERVRMAPRWLYDGRRNEADTAAWSLPASSPSGKSASVRQAVILSCSLGVVSASWTLSSHFCFFIVVNRFIVADCTTAVGEGMQSCSAVLILVCFLCDH